MASYWTFGSQFDAPRTFSPAGHRCTIVKAIPPPEHADADLGFPASLLRGHGFVRAGVYHASYLPLPRARTHGMVDASGFEQSEPPRLESRVRGEPHQVDMRPALNDDSFDRDHGDRGGGAAR